MNHPVISIVVPVYNVEKYICRCLDSLLSQSSNRYEIITVDDGSPDKSGTICDDYAHHHEIVRSFHKANGGLSSARNYGIQRAKGEWIAFVDSDDWVESDFVNRCLKAIANNPGCDSISYGYYIDFTDNYFSLDRKFNSTRVFSGNDIPLAIIAMEDQGMLNSVCNKLYSMKLIWNNKLYFQEKMEPGEDLLFNCSYFSYVKSCVLLQDQFYHYMRQGETTLTKKYDAKLPSKIESFDNARVELYNALHMDSDQYQQYIFRYYYSYVMSALYNNYSEDSQLKSKDRRCFLHWLFHDERFGKSVEIVNDTTKKKTGYEAVFFYLYNRKNVITSDYMYRMLFWLRNHMKGLYNEYRKRQLVH